MIYTVTGAGPRTGTSFVMRKLFVAGLPIYWTKNIDMPGAEFETWWEELWQLDNVIVKVWPNMLARANIGRMVVLRRDRDSQIKSIKEQAIRERGAGHTVYGTPEQMIDRNNWMLDQTDIERREYRTEELDDHIEDIVNWLSEPFMEQIKWLY